MGVLRSGEVEIAGFAAGRGRLMWFFLVSLHMITSFHRVSFNVIADLLSAEFGLTGAGLGNLAAAYTYMYVLMQIPGGMLVDRLGPRKMALLTGLAMASGAFVIAFSQTAALVFLGRMLVGLGGSVVLINIFKFQDAWFKPTEFATLSGLALLFSSSGTLLATAPLAALTAQVGWRGSFLVAGFFTLLVAVAGWLLVRDRPCGVTPNGAESIPASRAVRGQDGSYPGLREVLRLLLERRIQLPLLFNMGLFGGFIAFSGTWGASYLIHAYGMSVGQASGAMMVTFTGYMVGSPVAGYLSDRLGSPRKPALFMAFCSVLFWLIITAWPGGLIPVALLYPLCLLLGFGAAATILSFPMAYRASSHGNIGSVTAVVNLGPFVGLAILQPLTGYVLDLGWEGRIIEGARIYSLLSFRCAALVTLFFALVSFIAAYVYRDLPEKRSS